jgi:hypothetical protein
MSAAEQIPEGWLASSGLRSVSDGTLLPRLAYAALLQVETLGSAYIENDHSMEVLEAAGLLVGVCEQMGYLCLQETAFLYAPLMPTNVSASSGILIVNKNGVRVPTNEGRNDG